MLAVEVPTKSTTRLKGPLIAVACLALLSLILAGVFTARALSVSRRGTDATATIERRERFRGQDYALVQFDTGSGRSITTVIAICHHQSYPIGGAVAVRYDPTRPTRAWERDMPPRPDLRLPAALLLGAFLSFVALGALALTRAGRPKAPASASPTGVSGGQVPIGAPPAWHPDPTDPRQLRYWDGFAWTHHISANSQRSLVK
jgi:Protein of unknown function (DUF2510)